MYLRWTTTTNRLTYIINKIPCIILELTIHVSRLCSMYSHLNKRVFSYILHITLHQGFGLAPILMWPTDWKENLCSYGNGSYAGYICRSHYTLLLIMANMGIAANISKIWYVCNHRQKFLFTWLYIVKEKEFARCGFQPENQKSSQVVTIK